ncbi:MAG: hypothetical protein LBS50_06955 [Prevotellaceae bacterium]|jgi:hypothetical protein|nr:hypothetical protein [Prevotellaceae bacterium]
MPRKKIDINSEECSTSYSNWLAQVCNMTMTKNFFLVAGRGSSKTTEFQVERLMEMAFDMPGAPIAWVSDTYANLQQNILPMVIEGLERKGWREDIHFVVEKAPPEFTEKEKENLPENLKKDFWKPFNKIVTYKHTLIIYTGLNITFGSLDRPSSLAGRSYVHIIGDEVKYFPRHKINNLLRAKRGYKQKYSNSPFYCGVTFTTDMPNIEHIGEHNWILEMSKTMNVKAIMTLIQSGLIVNQCRQQYYAEAQHGDHIEAIRNTKSRLDKWENYHRLARMAAETHNFYYVASSYVNVDILTPEWFRDAYETDFIDAKTSILSILPSVESGNRFYANLSERHFYYDGTDSQWEDYFGLREQEDCRILKYLNINRPLEAGMDFGNMMSMSIFQENLNLNEIRVLKFLHTLKPDNIPNLADKFVKYFETHQNKKLILHYDRTGNNQLGFGQTNAIELKNAIETYQFGEHKGKRTGWRVELASLNQGNIGQQEEYYFMEAMLSESNRRLPAIRIDAYQCKALKCSLELARTKKVINAKGVEYISKDKTSEKLQISRLLYESTNPSDSLKYGLMTRERREILMRR